VSPCSLVLEASKGTRIRRRGYAAVTFQYVSLLRARRCTKLRLRNTLFGTAGLGACYLASVCVCVSHTEISTYPLQSAKAGTRRVELQNP
ncbi:unnamed protein product, partial [Ectocarpus sp. 8 AP-2014]